MAQNHKELKGWKIIVKDEFGQVVTDTNKRASRRSGKVNVQLQRESDGLIFSRGSNILVNEESSKENNDADNDNTETDLNDPSRYSVYLVGDIRLNTTSHIVEVWAYSYLRHFELDPIAYYKQLHPELTDLNDGTLLKKFEEETDPNEIYLTVEYYELPLYKIVDIATVINGGESWSKLKSTPNFDENKNFFVNYSCNPDSSCIKRINYNNIQNFAKGLTAKEFEQYLKNLSSPKNKKSNQETNSSNQIKRHLDVNENLNKISKLSIKEPKIKKIKSELNANDKISVDNIEITNGSDDSNSIGNESRSASDPGDNSEESGNESNFSDDPEASSDEGLDTDEGEIDSDSDDHIDEEEEIEEEEEDDDFVARRSNRRDLRFISSNGQKTSRSSLSESGTKKRVTRGRPKKIKEESDIDLSRSSHKSSKLFEPVGRYTDKNPIVRKFTKRNVVRAKKKYTPFSKRFKSIKDIPDLTKLAEFNQSSTDLQISQLEDKLKAPKGHEVVETIFSKVKRQLNSTNSREEIVKSTNFTNYLPGRENEYASIYLSLYSALQSTSATTIYIAGTPGVGKTLTVREVIKELHTSMIQNELPKFQYVEINGLKMVKPTDSYEVLWNKISGEQLTWGAAMESLEFYFNKVPKNKKRPIILLLDELDALVNKSQDIMYNFFNWTTYENAQLIVLAVANTMDLPEKELGNKVSSRIGFTRIMFTGYTYEELNTIIHFRLKGLNNSSFYVNMDTGHSHLIPEEEGEGDEEVDENDTVIEKKKYLPANVKKVRLRMSDDAIEIASRKVASVSGDARRALKICKRATEIAEQHYMARHGFGYDGDRLLQEEKEAEQRDISENGKVTDKLKEIEYDSEGNEIQTVRIFHIMKALNEIINSPSIQYISDSSFTIKLFLYAFLNLVKKTGTQEHQVGNIVDEIELVMHVNNGNKYMKELYSMLYHLGGKQGDSKSIKDGNIQLRILSWDYFVSCLVDSGIITKQTMRNERVSLIKLQIPTEDVQRALDKDVILKSL
ncbi:hypothetical protein TBLA_0E04690 [Henningerozyma blattae CBS 6284]|uniref:Origin recognition complex subunit 1 n=1 Tax=Henningerozyma blattae (strain ATCC 34711 / CBS 6284 / DSM 70876 / NBRC 10599 / NRRL Y-10934 / UCD 77-7) TaxID=1071380 RepID=I2H569_HENB6|nr:hypothetical protein TBLA_0E04690 [Tetrapisispora blattae CBS 6284]CCH61521.1 hypothetical protein TBLA_0E04690 [Tetrapisispora blattae CBS 6284]